MERYFDNAYIETRILQSPKIYDEPYTEDSEVEEPEVVVIERPQRRAYPGPERRSRHQVDDIINRLFVTIVVGGLLAVGAVGVVRTTVNEPQARPTPPRTATLSPRQRRLNEINAELYKELQQSLRNPDGRLATSLEITDGETDLDRSNFANVRLAPQMDSEVVARFMAGTKKDIPNIEVPGDDKDTQEYEENGEEWTAFKCEDAGITKTLRGEPISPETMCTVNSTYTVRKTR